MSLFPAVLIGGPPHSGKSVLVYSLTQALRARGVAHYALRACPDGEGDFSNETDQAVIRLIRRRGQFSTAFTSYVSAYLRERRLPLLVDVGGRPTDDQIAVFSLCTGAVLLVGERPDDPAAYARDHTHWLDILDRAGLTLLADLRSDLHGNNHLAATTPVVVGTLSGLERGQSAAGPAFEALVDRLAQALAGADIASAHLHRAAAPPHMRLVVVEAPAPSLGAPDARWSRESLNALAAAVVSGEPVAIYGRAPNWVYAHLALHAAPAEVWLFDARQGWMTPPPLPRHDDPNLPSPQPGWQPEAEARPGYTWLDLITNSQYIDPNQAEGLPLPVPPPASGLVISGRVPYWLLLGAARQLAASYAWLAVYHPPLNGAVVVWSPGGDPPLGHLLPV